VLGNHDQPRIASRVGRAQARIAALLLLTLRGTPTLYYGDELGMENVPIPPEREQDPFGKNMPGTGQGRDPQRTPMQWDVSPFAGFSTVEPWLPLAPDWQVTNVQQEQQERDSMLNLTRALLELRRRQSPLSQGSYRTLGIEGDVLVYLREDGHRRCLVALNLVPEPKAVLFGEASGAAEQLRGEIALSTYLDRVGEPVGAELALRADEGVVVVVEP
jgi:alpha-glucosidase